MTEPLSAERIGEIVARAKAATPGPWRVETHAPTLCRLVVSEDSTLSIDFGYVGNRTEAEAEFVAHAREDIDTLLDEIERLRGELSFFAARVNELESRYCECTPVREHDDYKRPAAYQHAADCPVTDASITRDGGDR